MKKFWKNYGSYILIIISVVLIRSFIVTPIKVSGSSMVKTLEDGEIMLLYKLADIKREDIVVVDKSVEGNLIIKRVIGMPGDTISCKDSIIYINDEVYDDNHAYGITTDFAKLTLGDDEYFVLGDNRKISKDSRVFGPIKREKILGQANIVIFPFDEIGWKD